MAVSESVLISAGLRSGLLRSEQVTALKLKARQERARLIDVVTRTCRFPEIALYQALADQRGLPFLTSKDLTPDLENLKRFPSGLVQRRLFLPVRDGEGAARVALSDPDDQVALDNARRVMGRDVSAALTDPKALEVAVARAMRDLRTGVAEEEEAGEPDSIAILDEILREAYVFRASDVHFEPVYEGMRVRLRVDGRLQEHGRLLTPSERDAITVRIKVLSALDIAEQRTTQDGGFSYQIGGPGSEETDIRVATVPARWGERCTLRLLGHETNVLGLEDLGMPEPVLRDFRRAIEHPHGIILVTGPTGSGKSTTLYAALRELDADQFNILSVEDPIEQIVEGVTQVQVNANLAFARALRSFLRHDPDVLLVGEIRDQETADAALKAALTGHLVLSTLHTNDAAGAVTRLSDIGSERYLIAAGLLGVVAQRLVRRLCTQCRVETDLDAEAAERLGVAPGSASIWRAVGCPSCLGTGYQGRVGIFEAIWCDEDLAQVISDGASEAEIRNATAERRSLARDAREKVLAGITSLEEVRRLGIGI